MRSNYFGQTLDILRKINKNNFLNNIFFKLSKQTFIIVPRIYIYIQGESYEDMYFFDFQF